MRMREEDYKQIAIDILKQKGFTDIKWLGKPYDIEAHKNGAKYVIDVKGSAISFTTSWLQVKALYQHYVMKKKERALLMFIHDEGDYCIFQMIDAICY